MTLESRKDHSRVSSATATLGLTLLFLVLFAALTGFMIQQSYKDAISRAEARAMSSAHVVSAHTSG